MIKKFILYFFLFFLTQKSTIEEKQFSLLKQAGITSFISATAFITQKNIKIKKLSSPLKFLSFSLPGIYMLSHVGYTYAPDKYLNNIFKLTHKLYLDKVFFLSSPSQILAKKIEEINLEAINPELLSEALFYIPKEKQKNIILELKKEDTLNKIAEKRTDLSSQLIKEKNTENKKLETFLSKLTTETFQKIAKREYKDFTYLIEIKNIFNLKLFESDKQKIDFLEHIFESNKEKKDHLENINTYKHSFMFDYVNDTTTNIQLLMEKFQNNNIFNCLKSANRLHEIPSLLENPKIKKTVKKNILFDFKKFLESQYESDESKKTLRESLKKIGELTLWRTFGPDKEKTDSDDLTDFDRFDIFEIITKYISDKKEENENTIKEIFIYEIENFTDEKDLKFISLSFLRHPTIAAKILTGKTNKDIITSLLKFYTALFSNKDINIINLLLNIQTIFHEIEIPENNETKNLATLLKKDISEILENESLKNKIKNNDLYKKFLFNQIITKKKNIKSIEKLEHISTLLNLNNEQKAMLIKMYQLDTHALEQNKKTKIENIINSDKYKEKLTSTFNDFENLAEKIFFEKKILSKESLKNLATEYKKEEKTNFSDYEIENIAILSFFKIHEEETKEIIAKFEKQKSEEKNELLEKEIKKIKLEKEIKKINEEYNKILDQIKTKKNLLLKERIFIESINTLEDKDIDRMIETLTIEDLINTLLNNNLEKVKATKILSQLIQKDLKKARNVVKLMQKTNNVRFQILYIKLDSKLKIDFTKENE